MMCLRWKIAIMSELFYRKRTFSYPGKVPRGTVYLQPEWNPVESSGLIRFCWNDLPPWESRWKQPRSQKTATRHDNLIPQSSPLNVRRCEMDLGALFHRHTCGNGLPSAWTKHKASSRSFRSNFSGSQCWCRSSAPRVRSERMRWREEIPNQRSQHGDPSSRVDRVETRLYQTPFKSVHGPRRRRAADATRVAKTHDRELKCWSVIYIYSTVLPNSGSILHNSGSDTSAGLY